MNIEIEIKKTGIFAYATVSIDGVKMLTLPFRSVGDAEKWVESCKSEIESLDKECDCPKCREEKEAEKAKSEPEIKPEEPKPNWTPAVGMLIQSEQEGIWEITGILTGGASLERVPDRLRGNFPNHVLANYRPIAELEGLRVGDRVFSINQDGVISEWAITIVGSSGKIVAAFDAEEIDIALHVSGGVFEVGNGKQMFWRTAERAERFGK